MAPSTREPGPERRANVDVDMKRRDGRTMPVQLSVVNLLDDPTVSGLIVSGQDISELQAARRELAHAAEHDDLTGLPNRGYLTRLLRARLALDGPRATAVAFLDLDRFKTLNDLFGHEVGDEILITVARRLEHAVRATDIVTRFGGDEFVVVAPATSDAEVDRMVRRLEEAVSEPIRLPSGPHQVFASVGLVIAHPGDLLEDVLSEADSAMYEAKNRRRCVGGGRTRPLAERRALAEDLDQAFRMGQFEVHYQPIVELVRGETFALEALVRWRHPRRGLLLPADFLDVVRDTGRDGELGDLVASTAMGDLTEFAESSRPDLAMAINVSMSQLTEAGFADRMAALVLASGGSPRNVVVEVSERGLLDKDAPADESPVRDGLQSLSDAGFRVGVEDFGTGCSSLSNLVRFPVDVLKIDRSFVGGIGQDESRESIVAALIGLAHAAGLGVVAEGVEHESQISTLKRLGCPHGQGFYFCRPLPPAEMLAELRAQAALAEARTERIA